MIRTWRVAIHECLRHVRKRRFLLGVLSVPLVVVVMVGLIFLIIATENNATLIGCVDHCGRDVPRPSAAFGAGF